MGTNVQILIQTDAKITKNMSYKSKKT
jgi:hypothetical protein